MTTDPLSSTNGQLMMMAAHRYCLGRRSYIVSSCVEWLREYWPLAELNTRRVILRNTAEALHDWLAGSEMDEALWRAFLAWGVNQLGDADRNELIQSVEHVGRNWVLPQ